MEKEKKVSRYLKVTIITVVATAIIIGGVFGLIYDKDRIEIDIQSLKTSISIANSLNFDVSFEEGFIVLHRGNRSDGRKVEIHTLKNANIKKQTIQVNFKSFFFSDSVEIQKTDVSKRP